MESNKSATGKIHMGSDIGYNECYYGSNIRRLSSRMSRHRSQYAQYKDTRVINVSSFQLLDKYGIEGCKIELVENYPSSSTEELCKKEGEHLQNNT